jgi:hypothetical protein
MKKKGRKTETIRQQQTFVFHAPLEFDHDNLTRKIVEERFGVDRNELREEGVGE